MTSRSKTQHKEKEKPPVEVPVQEEKEIVQGKLYEQDWNLILKQDEGVDIAVEIVSEITELAWTVVHEHMIEEQSFAFACERATEEMLQIVEWHYLSRDDGELNTTTDPSWNEDNEPLPAQIDTWARGIIPLTADTSLVDQPIDKLLHKSLSDIQPTKSTQNKNKIEEVVNNTTSNEEAVTKEQVTEDVPIATTEPVNKKPTVVAKTRRRIVAKTSPMVAVAIESSSQVSSSSANSRTLSPARHVGKQSLAASLKSLKYLPVKPSEVEYDNDGCIVSTVKLDPRKFPSHKVHPSYSVSDAPLVATRSLSKKPPLASIGSHRPPQQTATVPSSVPTSGISRYPDSMTLPSLVDTIDPVAGVTVLEGGRTRQGPRVLMNSELESPYRSLRPLCPVKPPPDNNLTSPTMRRHDYQLQT
ncbi:probable serine/threonine-protein kinase dyrk2 [Dysidea avara]|uniref:probable serine/threonine-protein kinase dyrk2 n=1 Tax=Dysidea avara TaxID=196820 RepID=UPI0033343FCF